MDTLTRFQGEYRNYHGIMYKKGPFADRGGYCTILHECSVGGKTYKHGYAIASENKVFFSDLPTDSIVASLSLTRPLRVLSSSRGLVFEYDMVSTLTPVKDKKTPPRPTCTSNNTNIGRLANNNQGKRKRRKEPRAERRRRSRNKDTSLKLGAPKSGKREHIERSPSPTQTRRSDRKRERSLSPDSDYRDYPSRDSSSENSSDSSNESTPDRADPPLREHYKNPGECTSPHAKRPQEMANKRRKEEHIGPLVDYGSSPSPSRRCSKSDMEEA